MPSRSPTSSTPPGCDRSCMDPVLQRRRLRPAIGPSRACSPTRQRSIHPTSSTTREPARRTGQRGRQAGRGPVAGGARPARRATRLIIALENLAPVFPARRALVHPDAPSDDREADLLAVGRPLHGRRACQRGRVDARTDPLELIEPALDRVVLFHLHDNLGARRGDHGSPELDPLRLDLHLPPGRGTVPWNALRPLSLASGRRSCSRSIRRARRRPTSSMRPLRAVAPPPVPAVA